MRKLTTKEFEEKLYKQNKHANDIELLDDYINRRTKMRCKCKVCGHIWEVTPSNLLSGRGCPKCANNAQTKTHEQFMVDFYKKNKHAHDIELLDDYVGNKIKIKCKCKIDGYEWSSTADSLLRGSGCPKCAGNIKLTHEEFITKLQQISPDIKVLGIYVTSQTKIKCKCKVCGYEWKTRPADLLRGHGCPKCVSHVSPTQKEFIDRLKQINSNIEVLGTYIKTDTKIKCRCKICDHEWSPTPHRLLQGQGCPKCAGVAKLTHEEFINRLQQVNPDIEVLGTYINKITKILCKCKKDGYEWEATPSNLLQGSGCPKCSTSKGEKRIAQYLDNLGIDYIYNMGYFNDLVGTGGGLMRPDFVIPSLKIWIEYDGIQHSEPVNFMGAMSEQQIQEQFKIVQENDQIKNQYAKDNNWTLIRIPFTEYDNIEQILAEYIEQEEQLYSLFFYCIN